MQARYIRIQNSLVYLVIFKLNLVQSVEYNYIINSKEF
jgi:hypothetical protein